MESVKTRNTVCVCVCVRMYGGTVYSLNIPIFRVRASHFQRFSTEKWNFTGTFYWLLFVALFGQE